MTKKKEKPPSTTDNTASDGPRSENKKRANRILDTASKLIIHYGFDKTTVDDIARESGVSKGAIYLHWRSKDELFEALIWREVWDYIDQWSVQMNADPKGGTLVGMYKHSINILQQRPLMQALYQRDLRVLGDFIRRRDPQVTKRRYLLNTEFIEAMQAAGLVRQNIDPSTVAFLLSSLSHGITTIPEELAGETRPSIEHVLEAVVEMLERYLQPPGGDDVGDSEAGKQLINRIVAGYKDAIQGNQARHRS